MTLINKSNKSRRTKEHLPHLTIQKSHSLNNRVVQPIESHPVWSSGIVGNPMHEIIPGLAVSINSAMSKSVYMNIIATQYPSRRLVLIPHIERIFEPVRDIRWPLRKKHEYFQDFDVREGKDTSSVPLISISRFFNPVVCRILLTWYVVFVKITRPECWLHSLKASRMAGASSMELFPAAATVHVHCFAEARDTKSRVTRNWEMETILGGD